MTDKGAGAVRRGGCELRACVDFLWRSLGRCVEAGVSDLCGHVFWQDEAGIDAVVAKVDLGELLRIEPAEEGAGVDDEGAD